MGENPRVPGHHDLASHPLIPRAVFVLAVALYTAVLLTHTCEVAGGSDSSGYANEAREIARVQREERVTELDRFGLDDSFTDSFSPLGYTPSRPGYVTTTYPPGLPMHMALLGKLFEWKHAPFYVSPIAAIAGIILLGLFAHRLFDSWWIATGAALAVGCCATYAFIGLQTMSDVLTATWTLAAMFAAWLSRGGEAPQPSGRAGAPVLHWSAIAGAALAISVWVRPSNAIVGLPFLFALPWTKKAFTWCIAAGAIVTAPLFVWNAKHYGSAFRTGYGAATGYFGFDYFPSHSLHYLKWTAALLTPLVFAGAIYSIILARRERIHLVLALWFWSTFVLYCFYYAYDAWWYTRFLLPAYPAVILSTIYAARAVDRRAIALALAAIAITGIYWCAHFDMLDEAIGENVYPEALRWADGDVPRDALVAAMQFSGARKYYKDRFSLRYDIIDRDHLRVLEQKVAPDRWYLLIGKFELDDALANLGGRWTPLGQFRDILLLHRDPNGSLSSH